MARLPLKFIPLILLGVCLIFELVIVAGNFKVIHSQQQASGPVCKRLLWFLAVDSVSTSEGSYRLHNARAALDSALEHAPSLVPVLIYGGKSNDTIARHFRERGALVVLHDVKFLPEHVEHMRKRRAQYYRLDAAALARELLRRTPLANVSADTLLYTDTDVLIEQDISTCSFHQPEILAIGPESLQNHAFNTGVMYVNIKGWLAIYKDLLAYADSMNWTFYGGSLQDQGLINEFFIKRQLPLDLLRNEYNWKGYWGWNPNHAILHFHGFKADLCLRTYVKGRQCPLHRRVCDHMGYSPMHYRLVDKSPDDKMWRYMYQEYLLHSQAQDDLASTCGLRKPFPKTIRVPRNLTALLAEFGKVP